MKELLKKTEELFDAVVEKKVKLDGLIKKNESTIERVEKERRELKERNVAVQIREAKVKEVEDVVVIKEANDKEDARIKKERKELKIQMDAFVKYESEAKKQLEGKKSKLESDRKYFETTKDKILADEKVKLKNEFMKAIAAGTKK